MSSKGDEYFQKAEGKVNKMFFKDLEGGYENFIKAGAQYRVDKEYNKAGDAYMRAGDIATKLKEAGDACSAYTDAANVYKKVNMERASVMLDMAIQLNIDNNRLSAAARLEKEFAEALENDGMLEQALIHYDKAANFFVAEDQPQSAMGCRVKAAKIMGEQDRFEECMKAYEDIGSAYAGGPLRHQAKEFFVRAVLCRLALVTNDNRTEKSQEAMEAFENYQLIDVNMKHTREAEFCEAVICAVDENDIEKFNDAVDGLNELKMLDDWKTHVLLIVKKNFEDLC